MPTAVYRRYDSIGTFLYVGITSQPESREMTHLSSTPWYCLVDDSRNEIEWFTTRRKALDVEEALVQTCRPIFNMDCVPRPERAETRRRMNAYVIRNGRPDLALPDIFQPKEQRLLPFTTGQAARQIGVSASVFRRWVESGVIKPDFHMIRSGHRRFHRSSIAEFKDRRALVRAD